MSKILAKSILKAQGSTSFDTTKVYLVGEKGSGLEPRGELQDFYKLKAICQREKKLFKDPYFTPKDAELRIKENVVWKRPPEFIKNPKFTVDGKSRFDINQGELGDCWFLAAVANVADSKLINFIAPDDDQDFDKNYAGIFHFRFWQYGRWVDVVIDDYLPTVNDQLILLHSTMTNELWSALLEKAYAKLNGSYAKLDGGLTSEGLEDLTGGLSAIYMVNYTPNLNKILVTSYKNSSFMGCALRTENMEDILANGLVGNHAYTISSVEELRDQKLILIRIRNPWGQQEWKGKWSDNSDAWKTLPEEISKELHSVKEDGEFWIEYSDFVKQFYFVEICYPNPNSYLLDEALPGIKWSCQMIDGEWIPNINSGGNIQSSSFDQNPQYFLTLDADSKVIVAVMQKKRRILGRENLSIGFAIYEVDSVNGRLANEALKKVHPVVVSDSLKQISHHADLSKGSYCIIPFTNEKGAKGQFLFRIYSSTSFEFIDANKSITENRNIWAEPTLPETDSANDTVDPVFRKLAAPDGEVDWKTLQLILNSLCKISEAPSKFSKEQSRSLVAIFDADYSGKLNCAEFKQLWRRIAFFKNHFKISDLDHSNAISGLEFLYSLQKMRFNLADRLISVLLGRYGNERNEIEFEDYIVCMCKLLNSIEIFFKNHTNKLASVTLEEWIQATMYT